MSLKYMKLFYQLENLLAQNMKDGISKLPSEKELCITYQVSRQTVRKALDLLEEQGLIVRIQGSGAYSTGLYPQNEKNTIALLLTSDSDYIYPSMLNQIQHFFSVSGFRISLYITNNNVATEQQILKNLIKNPPRGILAECCHSIMPTPNIDYFDKLTALGTSIVFLHASYPNYPDSTWVKDDNSGGSSILTDYLLHNGHTRIAGIFKNDDLQGMERYYGFVKAMTDQCIPFYDDDILWICADELSALEKEQDTRILLDFLQKKQASCSAIICHNDEIAYWLIHESHKLNIQIPNDFSIVSFDNSYLSRFGSINLTSLTHAPYNTGIIASELLIKKMQGISVSSVTVPWTLTYGDSVQREL